MNINKAIVIGRVVKVPELKQTPSGTSVVNFTLATNYIYTKNGEKKEETEYHNCVALGKTADIIKMYVVKGQELYVEGRLKTSTWEDKDTQKKMYKTEIIVNNMQFGQKPKFDDSAPENPTPQQKALGRMVDESREAPEYSDPDINLQNIPF